MKKSINIAGNKIKIKYQKNIVDEKGRQLNGYYNPDKNEIVIDKELEEQSKQSALNHEIMHAIDIIYNIELSHKQIYQLEAALNSLWIKF